MVAGRVAPAVACAQRQRGQRGSRAPEPVRPVINAERVPKSERRCAVALALQRPRAAPAKRGGKLQIAEAQSSPGGGIRKGEYADHPAFRASFPPAFLCLPLAAHLANRCVVLDRLLNQRAWGCSAEAIMSNTRNILVVDDDQDLARTLAEQLTLHEEFSAQIAHTAAQALAAVKGGRADLILLDVGLPDMDGREACRILRKNNFKNPIIMLTAQDSDSDTILGLESGANDYVTKPFRFAVLLARIRAQLRQHEHSEEAVFSIGDYTFRPAAKLLVDKKGGKVRLTEKETSILKYLYRAGEKVISRDTLLHEVWGYNAGVTTHTLETHIYRLRQKIERDPSRAELLITESGGYKLIP